tara:strand:- start:187 stop:582 length:396 start_codon:yes stop_codon:yes gene_type:complete
LPLKKAIKKLVGLRDLHTTVAFLLIFTNAIAGVWGILLDRESIKSIRFFWTAIVGAQIVVFAQAIVGVALQSAENIEPDDFHYLYGFSMIIAIALLYGYRNTIGNKKFLLYGLGSLFIMGLGIRAMFLGTT